jgi:MFS family permease
MAQVGLGLTAAGVVSFFFAVPLGKQADRIGPKRMWALGALGQALLYLAWPFIDGFVAFLVMMIALEVIGGAGWSGRGAYTIDVFPREERVRSQAFMRAALNIGFTFGALLGGLALATDSDAVVRAIPVVTAVILLVNTVWVVRLPDAAHDRTPAPAVAGAAAGGEDHVIAPGALRNQGFLALMTSQGVLGTNQVLLNVVIPLWLVEETDAPRVLLAWLFGTNTVMAVFLQVAAARGVTDVSTCLRAAYKSAFFMVLSCGIVAVTHDTVGWVTIALVWIGHVTVTGAELFESAASWGFQSELSDPDRLGEYQGASHIGFTLGSVWAPAAYTFLAMEWGAYGWAAIAGLVVIAAAAMRPAARAAERHLASHGARDGRPAEAAKPA